MKSKVVFRNYDKKAIKTLLKEIGKERYNSALKDVGLDKMPPIRMEGFFVEYDTNNIDLYHRYPSNTTLFIMSVLGFWSVPIDNWKMIFKDKK